MTLPPYDVASFRGSVMLPAYDVAISRGSETLPAYDGAAEGGSEILPRYDETPYREMRTMYGGSKTLPLRVGAYVRGLSAVSTGGVSASTGFLARFRPRNGWMPNSARRSLSGPR